MAEVAKKSKKAPAAAPVDKKARKVKLPKTIAAYWRAKDKNPEYFVFTPEGNLGTYLTEGAEVGKVERTTGPPVKLFDLPMYVPITREETEVLWAERQSEFEDIYESIESARKQLREALAAYAGGTGTARQVVIANKLVQDEEAKLVTNRSAKRWSQIIENPTTNEIDLQQPYEVRKLGFDVAEFKQFAIDPQKLVKALSPAEEAGFTAARMSGGAVRKLGVITDETLLGLHWPVEFKVGNTLYFTAFQAILGEMARQQDESLFQSILGTRSSRTLRSLTKDYDSSFYQPEIIQPVITGLAKQFPEFRELLLNTGDDLLVYADVLDPIFSIGLAAEDPLLQETTQFPGENKWGEALMEARTQFRQENVVQKQEDVGITEAEEAAPELGVISKEEQAARAKAAIINARRRGKN